MAKIVKVKFLNVNEHNVYRDLTEGKIYYAFMPDPHQVDPNGNVVELDNEIWIASDDEGETVVARIDDNWELIETL